MEVVHLGGRCMSRRHRVPSLLTGSQGDLLSPSLFGGHTQTIGLPSVISAPLKETGVGGLVSPHPGFLGDSRGKNRGGAVRKDESPFRSTVPTPTLPLSKVVPHTRPG